MDIAGNLPSHRCVNAHVRKMILAKPKLCLGWELFNYYEEYQGSLLPCLSIIFSKYVAIILWMQFSVRRASLVFKKHVSVLQ
jgi:hypothetical protein